MMKVLSYDRTDTGGGVVTYWGILENGEHFVYCLDAFSFMDTDYGVVFTQDFFDKTGGDTSDWEKEHIKVTYYQEHGYPDIVKGIIRQLNKGW